MNLIPLYIRELLDSHDGKFMAYTDLGFYPLYYLTKESDTLCPECANDELDQYNEGARREEENRGKEPEDQEVVILEWSIIDYNVNWEDSYMFCDGCSKPIESAYGKEWYYLTFSLLACESVQNRIEKQGWKIDPEYSRVTYRKTPKHSYYTIRYTKE